MNKKIFWIAAALLAWFGRDGARGQQRQPVTSVQPDCMVNFNLSVASSGAQATAWLPGVSPPPAGSVGTSLVIDNHQAGCYGWTLNYASHGFSAISLHLQDAPDNAGGTAPGTWADMTVVSTALGGLGINPNTATTQAITATVAYFPWVRMNLTSRTGTGSVNGVLYGFKRNTSAKSGGGSSGGCPGGADTQVQYNSLGVCAGAPDVLYTTGQLQVPDGAIGAAGLKWSHTGAGSLGFYKVSNLALGFPDNDLFFIDSGTPTRFVDIQPQNINIAQTIHAAADISFFNAAGPGSGNVVGILSDTNLLFGPFSGGALNTGIVRDNADGILNVANAGLTKQPLKLLDARYTGYNFAGLAALVDGTVTYCANCQVTSSIDDTCATGGSGAVASRINGAWKCQQ